MSLKETLSDVSKWIWGSETMNEQLSLPKSDCTCVAPKFRLRLEEQVEVKIFLKSSGGF